MHDAVNWTEIFVVVLVVLEVTNEPPGTSNNLSSGVGFYHVVF
jgi:hypothetical protein